MTQKIEFVCLQHLQRIVHYEREIDFSKRGYVNGSGGRLVVKHSMVVEQDTIESMIIKVLRDDLIEAASHPHGRPYDDGFPKLWMAKDSNGNPSLLSTELMVFESHGWGMGFIQIEEGAFTWAIRSTPLRILCWRVAGSRRVM